VSESCEQNKFDIERHDRERQVLFQNEAFAIGMLQAVSGAAVFGVISQIPALQSNAGGLPVLIALTTLILALACAVLSAWFRHEYKKWDVKARVTHDEDERARRLNSASFYVGAMRRLMMAAALLILAALGALLVGLWGQYLCRP
jgi:hypothetical protein